MLIAQISDLHVKDAGTWICGWLPSAERLSAVISHINALRPAVDACVLTGDLAHDGTDEDYAELGRRMAELHCPAYPVTGNHDTREGLRAVFGARVALPSDGALHYVVEDYPVRLVMLDSLVPGTHGGTLGEAQLRWLDTTLAERPDSPAMVFLHHPPFATGQAKMDSMRLSDASALGDVIRRHPQVERVQCGHLHRPILTRFAGTIAATVPSTATQFTLSLDDGAGFAMRDEPVPVTLHLWRPETGLVTHLSYLGDHGPRRPMGQPHGPAPTDRLP